MRTALFSLCLLLLFQCTPTATLVIATNPPGATVSGSDGTALGPSPIFVDYKAKDLRASVNQNGCFDVPGYTAAWTSGQTVAAPEVELCGSPSGDYVLRLFPPEGQPFLVIGKERISQETRNRTSFSRAPGPDEVNASIWNDSIRNIQADSDRSEQRATCIGSGTPSAAC